MLEIISICLNIITIGLTIYELFSKKSSNDTKQYIQNNIIQQINPVDKIIELYERLLQSEREKIELLKNK